MCSSITRTGSVYVLVVVVVALVSVLGISALSLATTRTQVTATRGNLDQARLYAISGVELGLANANTQMAELEESGKSLLDLLGGVANVVTEIAKVLQPAQTDTSDGSIAYEYTNRNGDPVDDLRDGVWIVGTGRVGSTVWIERAFARIDEGKPLLPLASALHATGAITIDGSANITVSGAVLSSDDAVQNEGDLKADVSARALQGTGTHSGSLVTTDGRRGVLSRDAFAFYRDRATTLKYDTKIEFQLIAAEINSHGGGLSSEGIYFLDTLGANLDIKDSRIVGTLVIDASAGGTVTLGDKLLMQPFERGRPTLLVRGHLKIDINDSTLDESKRNMNPSRSPYEGHSSGQRDTEEYAPRLEGLIHVIGSVEIKNKSAVRGALVVDGPLEVSSGEPTITYDPRLLRHIPRHYGELPNQLRLIIQPDTWTRLPAD